ncbi:MAG: alpha/beta hydrolase [Lysobacteraceae bacterium]
MSKTLLAVFWVAMLTVMFTAPARAEEVQVSRKAYSLQVQQQGHGPIVVVFESGFGQGAGVWKDVISELGAECECIAYARAGLGKSGTDGKPKTIQEHLADLGAVMDALVPDRKVLLVGHSYGGLLVTQFARLHPGRLQGLVLVDPATMSQRLEFKKANLARVLADDKSLLAMLPPAMAEDYKLLVIQLDNKAAAVPGQQIDVPVALLTSTQVSAKPLVFEETQQGKDIWKRQHAMLFAEFSRGTHQYFATGHNIHREDPKAVANAIRVVAATAAGGGN